MYIMCVVCVTDDAILGLHLCVRITYNMYARQVLRNT